MLRENPSHGEIPPILSKMASCHGHRTLKDNNSSNSLSSLKSLVQWAIRVTTASYSAPFLRKASSESCNWMHTDTSKADVSLLRRTSFEAPVCVFCISYSSGTRSGVGTTLLVVYTFDKMDTLHLIASAYICTSYPFPETPSKRVTFEYSRNPYAGSLLTVTLTSLCLGTAYQHRYNTTQRLLGFLSSSEAIKSLFNFLRYIYPRHLGTSRAVILDTDEYRITHVGQGAFAVISRVIYKPTGETRVMKRITYDEKGLAKYLATNEIDTLKAMKGNHWFPPLLNDFTDGTEYIITMPFYQRGDLSGLVEQKGYLGRELAQFYSAQLVLAIHSLHKVGIIHRDIKTDNIFLDEQGHLVLADFGLAENIATFEGGEEMIKRYTAWIEARDKGGDDFPFLWVNHLNPLSTIGGAGTFWYTAPEVFRKEPYSFGVDYWSVGVIYHELITGHIPFNHYKPYPENKRPILDFRIKPGQLKDILPWEEEALKKLLKGRPEERPQSLTELKMSPIFNGVEWDKMRRREIIPPLLPPPLLED